MNAGGAEIQFRTPSEEFRRAFDEHTNGCVRHCECGRVYFDVGNDCYSWDEGELELLLENQKKDPDKFQSLPYAVGGYRIGGRFIVWDCACKHSENAARIEDLIVAEAPNVAIFLNAKARDMRSAADAMTVSNPEALRP